MWMVIPRNGIFSELEDVVCGRLVWCWWVERLMQSLFISSKDEMNVISMILTILASVYRLHGARTRIDPYKYAIAPLIYLVIYFSHRNNSAAAAGSCNEFDEILT